MLFTSKWEDHQLSLTDMESQIHCIETEAYGAVLRAFIAQSDVLSWGKEGLITELRKELRVSDIEHREILAKVNADQSVKAIRGLCKDSVLQQEQLNASGYAPVSVARGSCKRLKIDCKTQSSSSKYLPCVQSSPAAMPLPMVHTRDDQQDNSIGRVTPQTQAVKSAPHNKQKFILGKGRGSMVVRSYGKGSAYSSRNLLTSGPNIIEIRATDKLIHEVERVCGGENPDPVQVERAKLILREHERTLTEAIAKIADASGDDESLDPWRQPTPYEDLRDGYGFNMVYGQADGTVAHYKRGYGRGHAEKGPPCIDLQDED